MSPKWHFSVLGLVFVTYLTIANSRARTMYPWSNEAWFASPALTLLHKGYLGTTILETKGTWMEGLERRTYWMPPLHLLWQAGWFRLFGFSLTALRAISVGWGVATLLAWYWIVSMLAKNRDLALLSIAVAALDPRLLTVTVLGRPDMMCAGLGSLGLAAYLFLRNRSLPQAMAAGHGFVAASCLTHPAGVLYAGALVLLMLYYDWQRISWPILALAALPYGVGLSAWGIYILQAPAQFLTQFTGNISGIAAEYTHATRFSGLASPLVALKREYFLRYGSTFGWYGPAPADRIQVFALLVYTLAIVGCIFSASIRKHAGFRVVLLLGLWEYLVFALFDGLKGSAYLVHTLPLCATLLAICVLFLFSRTGKAGTWALAAAMFAFGAVQLGTTVRYLLYQPIRQDYEQVVKFLRNSRIDSQIIAASEFAFAPGFESGMIDDLRLGYFSGRRPLYIVTNAIYRGWFERSADTYPEIHQYMTQLLGSRYRIVLHTSNYTIYERIGR